MRVLPEYAGVARAVAGCCTEQDEAVIGLQASLRSSDSLKGIIDCARRRQLARSIDSGKLEMIERICAKYEQHQKDVRDHCLDYFNLVPSARTAPELVLKTDSLLREGKSLYVELRGTLLATM